MTIISHDRNQTKDISNSIAIYAGSPQLASGK